MATVREKLKVVGRQLDSMRVARDEIARVSDKWAGRAQAAEAALRNLVAAAGPFKIALEHQPDGARGKECMYFTGHDPTVADLVIIAAAITAAKEVLNGNDKPTE